MAGGPLTVSFFNVVSPRISHGAEDFPTYDRVIWSIDLKPTILLRLFGSQRMSFGATVTDVVLRKFSRITRQRLSRNSWPTPAQGLLIVPRNSSGKLSDVLSDYLNPGGLGDSSPNVAPVPENQKDPVPLPSRSRAMTRGPGMKLKDPVILLASGYRMPVCQLPDTASGVGSIMSVQGLYLVAVTTMPIRLPFPGTSRFLFRSHYQGADRDG